MTKELAGTLRVEVCHRPPVQGTGRKIEETLDEAKDRVGAGSVEESVWSPEVPATSESEAVEKYRRFSEWADRHGVSVEPPFEVRQRDSRFVGETNTVLVTPVLCLAVYFDDALLSVFPHTDGNKTVSVEDGLAELDVERRVVIRGRKVGNEAVSVAGK